MKPCANALVSDNTRTWGRHLVQLVSCALCVAQQQARGAKPDDVHVLLPSTMASWLALFSVLFAQHSVGVTGDAAGACSSLGSLQAQSGDPTPALNRLPVVPTLQAGSLPAASLELSAGCYNVPESSPESGSWRLQRSLSVHGSPADTVLDLQGAVLSLATLPGKLLKQYDMPWLFAVTLDVRFALSLAHLKSTSVLSRLN